MEGTNNGNNRAESPVSRSLDFCYIVTGSENSKEVLFDFQIFSLIELSQKTPETPLRPFISVLTSRHTPFLGSFLEGGVRVDISSQRRADEGARIPSFELTEG